MEPNNLTDCINLDSIEFSENINYPCEDDKTAYCDKVFASIICGEIINNLEMKDTLYIGSKRSRRFPGEMFSTKKRHDDKNKSEANLEKSELFNIEESKNKFSSVDSEGAELNLGYPNGLSNTSYIKKEFWDEATNKNDLPSFVNDSCHEFYNPSPIISRKRSFAGNHTGKDVLEFGEITVGKEISNKKHCGNLEMAKVKLENSDNCSNINATIKQHFDHDIKYTAELERLVAEFISKDNESTHCCSHRECIGDKCKVLHDVNLEDITIVDESMRRHHDVKPEIVEVKLEHSDDSSFNDSENGCSEHEQTIKNDLQSSVNNEVAILYEHVVKNKSGLRLNQTKEESPYYCKDCDISTNGIQTYESHLQSKKHRKNTKCQIPDVVEHGVPRFQSENVSIPVEYQTYEWDISIIQDAAENMKYPCPALNYITEIQGIKEAHYWCKLCHAMYYLHDILSHLNDFRHKLKCLKLFDLDAYKTIRSLEKCEAEYRLLKILKGIIQQHGFGKITVEKQRLDNGNRLTPYNRHERRWDDSDRLFSNHSTGYKFRGNFLDWGNPRGFGNNYSSNCDSLYKESKCRTPHNIFVPSADSSNFHCGTCNVHMKNDFTWQSHIRSARHASNFENEREGTLLEEKSFKIPNARAKLADQIDEIKAPLVGLDFIQETYDANLWLYRYKCLLCGSSYTPFDIIDHILSVKHRETFLAKIEYAPFEDVKGLNISAWNKQSLVSEMCENIEAEKGRGNIEVCTTDANYESQAA